MHEGYKVLDVHSHVSAPMGGMGRFTMLPRIGHRAALFPDMARQ